MKGFINEYGIDVPPCGTCKHKNKMVDEAPCDKCAAEIERLRNRNKFLEIEYKNQGNLFWARVQTSNLEAIKDFAERLKEIIYTHENRVDVDGIILLTRIDNSIDNLVKEMTEVQE